MTITALRISANFQEPFSDTFFGDQTEILQYTGLVLTSAHLLESDGRLKPDGTTNAGVLEAAGKDDLRMLLTFVDDRHEEVGWWTWAKVWEQWYNKHERRRVRQTSLEYAVGAWIEYVLRLRFAGALEIQAEHRSTDKRVQEIVRQIEFFERAGFEVPKKP